VFRHWRAAESYYTNSLRQLKIALVGAHDEETENFDVSDVEDEQDAVSVEIVTATPPSSLAQPLSMRPQNSIPADKLKPLLRK
jgi:hypothetical protein